MPVVVAAFGTFISLSRQHGLMQFDTGTKVVLLDAFLAASFVFQYWLGRQLATNDDWWVAVPVALVTFALFAAADRSRAGLWTLVGAGLLAMAALVGLAVTGEFRTFPYGWFFLGLAVAMAVNRFLFGVVRPVPKARRHRMDPSGWVDE